MEFPGYVGGTTTYISYIIITTEQHRITKKNYFVQEIKNKFQTDSC